MSFAVGSLVRARGREWVVQPGSDDDLVLVQPLGGRDLETTGILASLEPVEPATFDLPDPTQPGDATSARLLRDALRLGFRNSAGPFRSIGRIAVEPRPYQLVPLLMALRLDPVRLLIADDVGIGKTIEASLILREMLDTGEIRRFAVLCPPHLAEQWQTELADKFHIDAELVLASTASRLERGLPFGRTIFEQYPHVVVSTDFIKSDRHRDDFVRTAPEMVVVDEAHTCADPGEGLRGRHQRHQLVSALTADTDRHVLLVTATPHSGKEGAFRSLLGFLDPAFETLPDDLSGDANRRHREHLARHLVQRRRPDIASYLGENTRLPARHELTPEPTYRLSPPYRALFDQVLALARETVQDDEGGRHRQRVRWWSALALLRALASSPAAAAATLRTRAAAADTSTVDEADEVGERTVLDLGEDSDSDIVDVVPGGDPDAHDTTSSLRRRLRELAKQADALRGAHDAKLVTGTGLIQSLIDDGFSPIVFCRFIDTAEYLADELRSRLGGDVEVVAVTGRLPHTEREQRVDDLCAHPRRVLVATDCLSEGINLQGHFDAVVHYDLPWNPTRLEQREGRVDRFGQDRDEVRVATYYGEDNRIDDAVLEVLLRKHRKIRSALGVAIPVPGSAGEVMEAVAERLLLSSEATQERLEGFDEILGPTVSQLHLEWDRAEARERRSRAVFAQHAIRVDDVAAELAAVREAIGAAGDAERFVRDAVHALGGTVAGTAPTLIDLSGAPVAAKDAVGYDSPFTARFALPVGDDERLLARTDPFVAGLAAHLLDTAVDPLLDSPAARCGVMRTAAVTRRTTLIVARYRFHLVVSHRGEQRPLLAEEAAVSAFTGPPNDPLWLPGDHVGALLDASPSANVDRSEAQDFLGEVIAADDWRQRLADDAHQRAGQLLDAHERVRAAARQRGVRHTVTPQLPPDVLGVYVLLPGRQP